MAQPLEVHTFEGMRLAAFALAALLGLAGSAAAQDAGVDAFKAGEYDRALTIWLPAARAGNPAAQTNIGVLWQQGLIERTPANPAEASHWYALAAEQGYRPAMTALGTLQWQAGMKDQALAWLNLAASGGEGTARNVLTTIGQPVPALGSYSVARATNSSAAAEPIWSPNYFGGGASIASPNYMASEQRALRSQPDVLDRALPSLTLSIPQ